MILVFNTSGGERAEREGSDSEVLAGEGLAELPVGGGDVPGGGGSAVAAGDAEGERLADQRGV